MKTPAARGKGLVRVNDAHTDLEFSDYLVDRLKPFMTGASSEACAQVLPHLSLDDGRALAAIDCISHLVLAFKANIDMTEFRRHGGIDALELLEAIQTGRSHPALNRWQELREHARGRPEATGRIQQCRRLVAGGALALILKGMTAHRAHSAMAEAATKARVLGDVTPVMVKNWAKTYSVKARGTDSAQDVAESVASAFGNDVNQVARWCVNALSFIGRPPTHDRAG